MLIAFAEIVVCEVEIGFFRDFYTGVSENLAEGVNVHAAH